MGASNRSNQVSCTDRLHYRLQCSKTEHGVPGTDVTSRQNKDIPSRILVNLRFA